MVSEQIAGVGVSGWNFHRLNRHESARFKDATNSKVNKLTTPFQKMSPLVFSIILFWINYNAPRKFEHFKGYLGIHLLPLFSPCYLATYHVPRPSGCCPQWHANIAELTATTLPRRCWALRCCRRCRAHCHLPPAMGHALVDRERFIWANHI